MAWRIEGRYFENCSCDMPCPCTVTFDAGADLDRCNALLVFRVDPGEIDGVDVGRTSCRSASRTAPRPGWMASFTRRGAR